MSTRLTGWMAALLAGALFSAGCAETTFDAPNGEAKPGESDGATGGGKQDAWNAANDPTRFNGQFVTQISELPRSGRSERIAWPSTYWPTYEDSINVRWEGASVLSPAEKYDRAFNGWTPAADFMSRRPFNPSNCDASSWDQSYYDGLGPLARYVAQNMGNWHAHDGVDNDNDGQVDECDDHDGVEGWWGLCHAWVPASMLEDRAERAVTYNGITFQPSDLDALLIGAYNRTSATMIGGRCNLGNNDEHPIERDDHGRPTEDDCRDLNPGSLHIIMTNRLGIQHRPFAMDRTYDYQVWNQPVVAFEVTRLDEIDAAHANQLLGVTGATYPFNANAVKFYDVNARLTYISESYPTTTPVDPSQYERSDYLTYVLEVDAQGAIIGGEYYGSSVTTHPDFFWDPERPTQSSIPNLDLDNVRMLIAMSREPEAPTNGNANAYAGQGNLSIPDNDPTGITSVAAVTDSVTVGGLQVELDIAHTYIGDLRVSLSHDGIERVISNNEGGSSDNIQRTITVPGFEGVAAHGDWTLHVVDSAAQDVGTLRSWRLLVTPGSGTTSGGTSSGDGDVVTVSGRGGIDIPDNDPTGITATASLSQDLTIGRLQIDLDVTHTYVGDLVVTLSHGGVTQTIHNRDGGDSHDIHSTIDVNGFAGASARGDWTLAIQDLAGQDVGRLNSWTLRFIAGSASTGGTSGGSTGTAETFPGAGGMAIPDNDPSGIHSDAGVPNDVTSGHVSVAVNITHTYRGDLVVSVAHGSYHHVLSNQEGGSADDLVQTFALTDFSGSPAGTWTLTVVDKAAQDTGTLNSWSVSVAR